MLDPAATVSAPAPGRSCGTCTLCCKVFDVPALEKLAGQLPRIDSLTVTPDLLTSLVGRLSGRPA